MAVNVIRTTWNGGIGGEGLTQLAVGGSGAQLDEALEAVHGFWTSIAGWIPNEYSLRVETLVEHYDEASGDLTGDYQSPITLAPVNGINAGEYHAAAGGRIDWRTSSIRFGRRVRGRTFLVPIGANNFSTGGSMATSWITGAQGYANSLLSNLESAGCPLQVWSRPSEKHPVGAISKVVAASVPQKAAILSGRRD